MISTPAGAILVTPGKSELLSIKRIRNEKSRQPAAGGWQQKNQGSERAGTIQLPAAYCLLPAIFFRHSSFVIRHSF
jgi:hypothetical protein